MNKANHEFYFKKKYKRVIKPKEFAINRVEDFLFCLKDLCDKRWSYKGKHYAYTKLMRFIGGGVQ